MRRLMVALLVLLSGLAAGAAPALEGKPKLGPDAVPIPTWPEETDACLTWICRLGLGFVWFTRRAVRAILRSDSGIGIANVR